MTTMTTAPALDMGRVQTFAFKVLGDVTAAQMGPLNLVADRLNCGRNSVPYSRTRQPSPRDGAPIGARAPFK